MLTPNWKWIHILLIRTTRKSRASAAVIADGAVRIRNPDWNWIRQLRLMLRPRESQWKHLLNTRNERRTPPNPERFRIWVGKSVFSDTRQLESNIQSSGRKIIDKVSVLTGPSVQNCESCNPQKNCADALGGGKSVWKTVLPNQGSNKI